MKIAVMGMGVAGSYLMARLKDSEHEVVGYERMVELRHDSNLRLGDDKVRARRVLQKDWQRF